MPTKAPDTTAILVTTSAAVDTDITAAWVEPTPVLPYAHRNATNTPPNDAAATNPNTTACIAPHRSGAEPMTKPAGQAGGRQNAEGRTPEPRDRRGPVPVLPPALNQTYLDALRAGTER